MPKRTKPRPTTHPTTAIRDRRRRELIEATITVIAKHGYAGTTVARVAREAGLSVGLMNFHFKSIDSLFDETFRFIAAEYDEVWREARARIAGEPAERRLERMVRAYFDPRVFTHRKVAVWFAFWSDANLRDRFHAPAIRVERRYSRELERTVMALAKERRISATDARMAATSLVAMIDGLWLQFMLTPKSAGRHYAVKACLGMLRQWLHDK